MSVNDSTVADAREHRRLATAFLTRMCARIEPIRRLLPELAAADSIAWKELAVFADEVHRESGSLKMGVLHSCARELAGLLVDKDAASAGEATHVFHVTSAFELIAIEVTARIVEYSAASEMSAVDSD